MPQAHVLECPRCGATIEFAEDQSQVECDYCGTRVIVPQELRARPAPPPPPPPSYVPPPEPAYRTQPRRSSSGAGCGGILAVLVIFGIIGAIGILGDTQTRESIFNPTPTVAPFNRPLAAELPRQVQYANLIYKLTQARITNEDPNAGSGSSRYRRDQAFAYLSLNVANPTRSSVSFGFGLIKLQLGDGTFGRDVTSRAEEVASQSNLDTQLVFAVPSNATWQGARLVLSEGNKEPATMPLEGAMPAAPYPVTLASGTEVTVENLAYKVTAASLDLDWAGKRVDAGKVFLRLSMRITNKSSFAGGTNVLPENFRLIVNGESFAPLDAPIETVPAQSALDTQVVFVISPNLPGVELQLGSISQGKTTRVALSLPGAKK